MLRKVKIRLTVLFAALALSAVTAQTTAYAAPTWQPPVVLSHPERRAFDVEVGFSAAGFALALYQEALERPAEGNQRRPNEVARVRERDASGSWFPSVQLSDAGIVHDLDLAVSPSGRALAAWQRSVHPDAYIETMYGFSGWTPWGDPTAGAKPRGEIQVAVDELGNALAVTTSSYPRVLRASYRSVFSSGWEQSAELDTSDTITGATAAFDRAGNAVAVWIAGDAVTKWAIKTSRRAGSTGMWSSAVGLAKMPELPSWPRIAIDGHGNVLAVWVRRESGRSVVEAASRPAGAEQWRPAVEISAPSPNILQAELAVTPNGDAVAVWSREEAGTFVVQASHASGGSWTRPIDLSAPGNYAVDPNVAVDARGNAVAVWRRYDGTREVVQAALRPGVSGRWLAATDIGNGDNPSVAIDRAGNALAAWIDGAVRASSLIGSGPILGELSVPTSAYTGRPVVLGVVATPWSNALSGEPHWQLGDGRVAVGASPTVSYARPGRYTVTVTQAEAGGGSSSLSAGIEVSPPPDPMLIVPGRGIGHVRLGAAPAAVVSVLGAPMSESRAKYPNGKRGTIARYPRPGGTLTIGYQGGRVVLLATNSRTDRTAHGVGPGSPRSAAARLVGYRRSPAGYLHRLQGTATIFGAKGNVVTHVSIARTGYVRP